MEATDIADLTARELGHDPAGLRVSAVPYSWGSPATAGLWTVQGADGREYFVKLLRHVALWPGLSHIPDPAHRAEFVQGFPWRFELDMHLAGIADLLPEGMRTPTLHHWAEPDAQHVVLWWERIRERPGAWTLAEYARASYLLGRLAGRRRHGAAVNDRLPEIGISGPNQALRYFVERRVLGGMVPALRSDELWHHPVLAAGLDGDGATLRADLLRLADHAPRLLDLLDTLPLTFAHGDASPQNLLVDARDPSTFVVIDWGFGTPMAVGFDLGQLLVGLMHAGVVDPDVAPAIDAALVAPYTRGACEEGLPVTEDEVRLGYHVGLALRTALVSLPVEELDGPDTPGLRTLVDQRVRLTRQVLTLTREATAVQTGHELASKTD